MQYIFQDEAFDKPFFLTYLDTSCFMVYLLGFFQREWRENHTNKISIYEHIKLAGQFGIFWFAANYIFNLSLNLTSVAALMSGDRR